tara:strand:+ start:69 stop:761 length:693 start_codon:yes stop_codon:yes gene_type:complete
MGNYNSKYFDRKDGSLEEAIRKAVGGIQEKVEYVEYKFKNKNDAMKAKKMLDAVQLMGFDINDDNINGGELMVDAGNKDMTKYHQEIIKKFRPKVMTTEKLVGGQKKLDKDKDGDIDGKDFAMLRKSKKENYELGTPENTKSKLDATPGQSADDWQKQVDTMQNKNNYMRETLAKMWGMKEGHNPFDDKKEKKEEKKDKKETKTMTGKPMTKVSVDPEMKETKIGKKNVR